MGFIIILQRIFSVLIEKNFFRLTWWASREISLHISIVSITNPLSPKSFHAKGSICHSYSEAKSQLEFLRRLKTLRLVNTVESAFCNSEIKHFFEWKLKFSQYINKSLRNLQLSNKTKASYFFNVIFFISKKFFCWHTLEIDKGQ